MSSATHLPELPLTSPQTASASVDVVVPVQNEQGVLPGSIRRLHDYLSTELPSAWAAASASSIESSRAISSRPSSPKPAAPTPAPVRSRTTRRRVGR
jgi:hypothetical protein